MHAITRIVSAQRCCRNIQNLIRISTNSFSSDQKWDEAMIKAEKIIGFPTSFMNLRWILTEEMSNIARLITQLIVSNHPLVKVAGNLLKQTDNSKWGMIVLLLSKAAVEEKGIYTAEEKSRMREQFHVQRSLAEITEMMKIGNLMHNSMVNITSTDKDQSMLDYGNKLALLTGDYLYSKSFKDLSALKNNALNEIMASALRDLSHSDFFAPRGENDEPLPNQPNKKDHVNRLFYPDIDPYNVMKFLCGPREEWILRNILGGITLLAKACKGTMILGGYSEAFQEKGFALGRSLGLAWQARQDLKPFMDDLTLPFSLTSAPVLFQLHEEPEMYELIRIDNENNKMKIRDMVVQGKGVSKGVDLMEELKDECYDIIADLPHNEASYCLRDLVYSLRPKDPNDGLASKDFVRI